MIWPVSYSSRTNAVSGLPKNPVDVVLACRPRARMLAPDYARIAAANLLLPCSQKESVEPERPRKNLLSTHIALWHIHCLAHDTAMNRL